MAELSSDRVVTRLCDLRGLKYLLFGSFQEKLADPWSWQECLTGHHISVISFNENLTVQFLFEILRLLVSLGVNSRVDALFYKDLHDLALEYFPATSSRTLAPVASMLFLKHARHTSYLRTFALVFPLLGILFPQMSLYFCF